MNERLPRWLVTAICTLGVALLGGALPAAAAPPGCAELRAPDDDGIGGTGFGDEAFGDEGLGGTGHTSDPNGGDGMGGTGIYGVLTSTRPLCVNGLRLHAHESTQVSQQGQSASLASLGVGQVVWVEAQASDGQLVARSIEAIEAVRGPVESLSPADGRLRVAGIEVELPALEGGLSDSLGLEVGDPVAVSGLWRDDERLLATRIERRDASTPHVAARLDLRRRGEHLSWLALEGFAAPGAESGTLRLYGLDWRAPAGAAVEAGARVWLRGARLGADRVRPERIERPPAVPPRSLPRPAPRPPGRPDFDRPSRPERIERPPHGRPGGAGGSDRPDRPRALTAGARRGSAQSGAVVARRASGRPGHSPRSELRTNSRYSATSGRSARLSSSSTARLRGRPLR